MLFPIAMMMGMIVVWMVVYGVVVQELALYPLQLSLLKVRPPMLVVPILCGCERYTTLQATHGPTLKTMMV
jgi:hypothetical protein